MCRNSARSISPEATTQYPDPLLSLKVVFLLGDTLAERGIKYHNCKGTGKLVLKSLESGHVLACYVKCGWRSGGTKCGSTWLCSPVRTVKIDLTFRREAVYRMEEDYCTIPRGWPVDWSAVIFGNLLLDTEYEFWEKVWYRSKLLWHVSSPCQAYFTGENILLWLLGNFKRILEVWNTLCLCSYFQKIIYFVNLVDYFASIFISAVLLLLTPMNWSWVQFIMKWV